MLWPLLAFLGGSLNLLDAILTVRAVEQQTAIEANPIMAGLIALSIPLFYLAKLAVAGLFGWLGYESKLPIARAGIVIGCFTYVGVAAYHMAGLLL